VVIALPNLRFISAAPARVPLSTAILKLSNGDEFVTGARIYLAET
jgi:hypothetical protein